MDITHFQNILIFYAAIALERWLPLSPAYHPFTIFKAMLVNLAKRVNPKSASNFHKKLAGTLSIPVILIPVFILTYGIIMFAAIPEVFSGLLLYLSLASSPLEKDAKHIYKLLKNNQKSAARELLNHWVLRDTQNLSQMGICKASIETLVLRNARHYFVVIFFYCTFGAMAAFLYRCVSMMAETWNVKIPRSQHFSKPVSICQMWLEWIPIRLVAICIALSGNISNSCKYIKLYAQHFYQTGSGWLLSTTSAKLAVQLGGPAVYFSIKHTKMRISAQPQPQPSHILTAINMINQIRFFWLIMILLFWGSYLVLTL